MTANTQPQRSYILTGREMQLLVAYSHGHTNEEVGAALFLAESTVKTHAKKLFRKLGARDRAHAIALGFRGGLLS